MNATAANTPAARRQAARIAANPDLPTMTAADLRDVYTASTADTAHLNRAALVLAGRTPGERAAAAAARTRAITAAIILRDTHGIDITAS